MLKKYDTTDNGFEMNKSSKSRLNNYMNDLKALTILLSI